MSASRANHTTGLFATLAAIAVCGGLLALLFTGNPRLFGSWHGFLHAGIASSFAHSFPPENPFFAGEPLPYYWFYHFVGYWISHGFGVNLLLTFQVLSWASLLLFVIITGLIGRRYFQSSTAGVVIAYLGLCGLNPLGPAIAIAKNMQRGQPLVERWKSPIETTFVSNELSDRLLTQPLLGAMYLGGDWRQGPDLVWFFDIGSRAPALAGLMLLLYLLLIPDPTFRHGAGILTVSAVVTALNPLLGIAVAGALGVAAVTRWSLKPILLSVACGAGALLALPTYYQMFFRVSGGTGFGLRTAWGPVIVAVNFLLLVVLAVMGARKAAGGQFAMIAGAGGVLLVLLAIVHLPEGNEHNLGNAAQCLLAVPAGALAARYASRFRIAVIFAAFLPVTAATLAAYTLRPPMPIAVAGEGLTRLPTGNSLQRFYDWAQHQTSPQSVFIVNPELPVKMSGNASEFPAFTSRTLFTDLPNYLTTPNRDAALRAQLAMDATQGRPLSAAQRDYLQGFGRPIYIVTYQAGVPDQLDRLVNQYGPAIFQHGIVAAFRVGTEQARR